MCQGAGGFKYCFPLQDPKDKMLCPVCKRLSLKKNTSSWTSASFYFYVQSSETVFLWRGELGGAFPNVPCDFCLLPFIFK